MNTGRETFILRWTGAEHFPFSRMAYPYETYIEDAFGSREPNREKRFLPSGNFVFKDDFSDKTLDLRWIGLRGPREDFVDRPIKGCGSSLLPQISMK